MIDDANGAAAPAGLPELARAAVRLAEQAGEAVLEIYAQEFEVEAKADASPLTQADLASQRRILAGLAELTPEVPVLAEEGAQLPYPRRRSWRRAWLVDPLDGTKEFVKRNGEFTINIALVEDGRPVLGVVHAPVLGVSYFAARGSGAVRLDAGGESQIRVSPPGQGPLKLVVSRSHAGDATQRLLERLAAEWRVETVSRGSSLKFCLVAEGSAHLYPRLGPTMEWDTAAAQCIVAEAGGEVLTIDGPELRYNREELRNPSFLACYGEAERWLGLAREAVAGPG